ncbi:MAG: hypothetical protein CVT80_07560, partial [Alphaproteobacteria bacterium HGW-Alphaproteobacteria-2]
MGKALRLPESAEDQRQGQRRAPGEAQREAVSPGQPQVGRHGARCRQPLGHACHMRPPDRDRSAV